MTTRLPAPWPWPVLVLVLTPALTTSCPGGPRPNVGPRARQGPATDEEGTAERALADAEARVRRKPRDRSTWRTLRRAAHQAGQPHRVLLALEATEGLGRLNRDLYDELAQGLRLRARNLTKVGAPNAALRSLARADRLAPPPATQRSAFGELRDRLMLQRADQNLKADDAAAARKVYRDLARRAVLEGEDLQWRRAALGETRVTLAVALALRRLRQRGPGPAQRLARVYLEIGGRDPDTLFAALEAATLGTHVRLVHGLDTRLAKVAPPKLLVAACRLRRRPQSPCCRRLQQWATTTTGALRRWAGLCRELHWVPGDSTWLVKAIGLLTAGTDPSLDLGPLEGIVPVTLARRAAKALPTNLALGRMAGHAAGLRQRLVLRHPPTATSSFTTLLQRSFEAWATGLTAEAQRSLDLALARSRVGTAVSHPRDGSHPGFGFRCQVIRLTRLVRGHSAAYELMVNLAQAEPRFRRHLIDRLVARRDFVAALGLARPGHDARIIARLEDLGRILARWGMAKEPTLRQRWARRYGSNLARRAWAHVTAGSRTPSVDTPSGLEQILRLVGQGRLAEADQRAKTEAKTNKKTETATRFGLWRARIAHLRGDNQGAHRRLRRLRHQDPGGFRRLPTVVPSLFRLGLNRTAGRLADELYERDFSDPALLKLVTLGAVAAGRYDKADLALTDWASATGRPDRAYLTVSEWMAARGQWNRAAVLASKGLGWSGGRPLDLALATIRHQRAAGRTAEARRTAAWLLFRWPAGNARNGISQSIAASLLAAHGPEAARPYLTLNRGLDLPALLRKRRFAEVMKRAAVLSRRDPMNGGWPALAALAAQGLKQWKTAARYVDQVARRAPGAEAMARALLLADQGRLGPALACLAQRLVGATKDHSSVVTRLAAALAARGKKRRLAARLISRWIVSAPTTSSDVTAQNLAHMKHMKHMKLLATGRLLPVQIPWGMLLAPSPGAGRCEP